MRFLSLILLCFFYLNVCGQSGQNCVGPSILSVQDSLTTQAYDWKNLQFNSVVLAEEYRVRFKKISATNWEYRFMQLDTARSFGFDLNETYIWNSKVWCDTALNISSPWSVQDTFNTNSFVPISFSPTFDIELSHYVCDSISDLRFILEQDPNEPDILSSSVFSSSGTFVINTLNIGDVIGVAEIIAGGGFYEFDYTLIVDQIISIDEAVIAMQNDSTGVIDGSFVIENDNNGIKIVNTIPADGNYYTTGNSSDIIFYSLFLNPPPINLDFYTSINSELGDNMNHSIDYLISCINSVNESDDKIILSNPMKDQFYFNKIGSLTLLDVSGKIIFFKDICDRADLSFLPRATYFLIFQTRDQILREKLILQ